jgi:hypothetical protein
MKIRTLIATIGCAILAAFFLVAPNAVVKGDSSPSVTQSDETVPDFKDKIVLFEVNRGSTLETKSGSVVLQKVHIRKLGTRSFIIGEGYAPKEDEHGDYWEKGLTVGVPCESLIRFQAMTPDQFSDYIKKWKEHSDK